MTVVLGWTLVPSNTQQRARRRGARIDYLECGGRDRPPTWVGGAPTQDRANNTLWGGKLLAATLLLGMAQGWPSGARLGPNRPNTARVTANERGMV